MADPPLRFTDTTMANPPLEEMISLTGLSQKTDEGDEQTSAVAKKIPSTLLTLPREIRDIIYELVWSDPGYVRLADRSRHRKWLGKDGGPTFPTEPAMPYPPKDAVVGKEDGEDAATSEESVVGESGLDDDEEDDGVDSTDGADLASLKSCTYTDSESGDGSDIEDLPCDKLILVNTTIAALLFVNRQLYKEASPILYKTLTFILDCDGGHCMNFFKKLSPIARQNITSIAITNASLMLDDEPSQTRAVQPWYGEAPLYSRPNGLTLRSPFATMLAKTLPFLSEFSFFLPCGGYGAHFWYCDLAPAELSMMLKYGRIERLSFVFFGESAAGAIEDLSSELCFEKLMRGWGNGKELAQHEFRLRHPIEVEGSVVAEMTRYRAEEKYVKKHAKPFAWEWGDRELDMGSCGNVQAVVACRRG